jgi:hypothetical protein
MVWLRPRRTGGLPANFAARPLLDRRLPGPVSVQLSSCIEDEVADSGPSKDAAAPKHRGESASRPDDPGITATTPHRLRDGDQPTVLPPLDRRDGTYFRHAGEAVTASASTGPQVVMNAGSAETDAVFRCDARGAATASSSGIPKSSRLISV